MNPDSCPPDTILFTEQKLDSQPITVHAFEQKILSTELLSTG